MVRPYLERVAADLDLPVSNDALWGVLLQLDAEGAWTSGDLDRRCNLNRGRPRAFITRLVAGGIAIPTGDHRMTSGKNPQKAPLYRLAQRPLECPRLAPDGRDLGETKLQTMWRVMKMLKLFTAKELAASASVDDRLIDQGAARDYCKRLEHVRVLAFAGMAGRERRYRLIRNLGAKAPKVLTARVIFDPNAGEVLGVGMATEVLS
jgi:hypothetical protein